MAIWDNLLERAGYVRKEKADIPSVSGFGGADPFALWRSNSPAISDVKAMQSYSGWVFASVRAIAEEMAKLNFKLYKVKKNDDYEEIWDHDLLNLLNNPNQFQTAWELKFMLAAHTELTGKAYWVKDGIDENGKGKIRGLYPLIPSYVKVKLGEFPKLIDSYEYRVNNKLQVYKPEQIIHFRYPDPNNMLAGFGVVNGIAQWIDTDNYQNEFNRRFFMNGAKVGGFLESETARSPEMLEYMKKSFEALFKGVENAYRVAALPKGTKFVESTSSRQEMDFVEGTKNSRDSILAGFRVPRTVLGITDDVNRANAEATDYVFATRTMDPKYRLICSFLNQFLVPHFGDNLVLWYEDMIPENRELIVREMQAATANQAVMSANEAREKYFGLGPVDGGDDVMKDFNKEPLGSPQPTAPADEEKSQARVKGIPRPFKKMDPVKEMTKEASAKITDAVVGALKEVDKIAHEQRRAEIKSINTLSDKEYEEKVWSKFITRLDPYVRLLTSKVREHNRRQEQEVLAKLPDAVKSFNPATKAIDLASLLDKAKWVGIFIKFADPVLTDLFEKEGRAAAGLVGFEGFAITSQVRDALDHALDLLSDSYTETTINKLKKTLEEGLAEGASIPELERKVNAIYDFSDRVRANQVAHTEVFRVGNDATHEAWKQSGVVKTIKWFTAGDDLVCEYCGPLNGKVISIDDGFFDKGDTVTGRDGGTMKLDYEDIGDPPLHVDCRCFIRPDEISID